MQSGWLAAGVAFALAAALVVIAVPREPAPDDLEAASVDEPEIAIAKVRDTGIAERPEWRVGDAWPMRFASADGTQCLAVVVEANEGGYRQGFSCENDEITAIVATQIVGFRTRFAGDLTTDLEGLGADDEVVRYFDWPLEDGKTWTTTFAGQEVEVQATHDGDGRFVLAMTQDGDSFASYDYDPGRGWWTHIEFASGYLLTIGKRERDWSGEAVIGNGEDRFELRRSATTPLPVRAAFQVEAIDDMLFAAVTWGSPTFAHRYQFIDPDGDAVWTESSTTSAISPGASGSSFNQFPAVEGLWSLDDQYVSGGEAVYRVVGVDLVLHEL